MPIDGTGITVEWHKIATAIVTGLGAVCLWVLKRIGDHHLRTLDTLVQDVSDIRERIAAIEGQLRERDLRYGK